jgi:hypothetical protein
VYNKVTEKNVVVEEKKKIYCIVQLFF